MRLIAAAAAAQRDIALAPRACRAGSALLDALDEEVEPGELLLGVFTVAEPEFDVGVLLDGEETGKLEDVVVGDVRGDVGVGETGGGMEEEDEWGEDETGDTGVGDNGVAEGGMEVEDGFGVVVVLDPPVIVNCGLAFPESPNTGGENTKSARVNMTSGHLAEVKELRTDDDVVGPTRDVRDSDLHRACAEGEVLGERVVCEMQQESEKVRQRGVVLRNPN
jgi:hypothetical protein